MTAYPEITKEAIEIVAKESNMNIIEAISLMQSAAAKLDDNEKTLEKLCNVKNEILVEMGILQCEADHEKEREEKNFPPF